MDLANSIIFLSFEVYLQLLNHWNLSNFRFARSSSKFELKAFSFKCLVVSNYVVVTLQLYTVKNGEFQKEEIIHKAITEVESETKPWNVDSKTMMFLEI